MVNPDVSTPVFRGTAVVSLNTNTVGVADLFLCTIAPSHDFVFSTLQHRDTIHGEAAVAEDDVRHTLHDKGDAGEEWGLSRLRIDDADERLVGSYHDSLAIGGLNTLRAVLLVA